MKYKYTFEIELRELMEIHYHRLGKLQIKVIAESFEKAKEKLPIILKKHEFDKIINISNQEEWRTEIVGIEELDD